MNTTNNKPSDELKAMANDLLTIAVIEPVELLPAEPETLTEKIEIIFFQRYLRTKKVTEKTGVYFRTPKFKTVVKDIEASYNEEHDYFEQAIEVKEFEVDDNGKKQFTLRAGTNFIELSKFPMGNQWKVTTYYGKEESDNLNKIIGRAVAKLREELTMTNGKGLNKAQPLYTIVPLAQGLVISNFQLYGTRNKEAGLQAKNIVKNKDGEIKEGLFARSTISQLRTVVERMQGNEMTVCKDWNEFTLAFPDIKLMKRK